MKNEFAGWCMGQTRWGDETRQYHAMVNFTKDGVSMVGALCHRTRRCSGSIEHEPPEKGQICKNCLRKLPTFVVIEHSTGFEVMHVLSGERHWMSDGVDVLFDKNDKALSPGSPNFRAKWEESLNETGNETMEAYFPELQECSSCGTFKNVESTYCGSFCEGCFDEHCEECQVCADDRPNHF